MAGNTRRIVLLGKTGTGKSSLANTLFGEKNVFKVSGCANSVTRVCKSETRTIYGRKIQLIDTPGFFDTALEDLKPELLRCITEAAPGPHAFLLVFSVGRFSPQEEEVVNLMVNEYFGEEALKYTTVVFTHGDDLEEGVKIEEWAKKNKALKNLLEKCNNRCCVFDNKHWNKNEDPYRNNQIQIQKLLDIIDQTLRQNKEKYYTNELLQDVQKRIEEKKRQLKLSSPNISEEKLLQKAKELVQKELNYMWMGVAIGVILGALLGGVAGFALAKYFSAACGMACFLPVAGAAVGGAAGGAIGGVVGSRYTYKKPKNA